LTVTEKLSSLVEVELLTYEQKIEMYCDLIESGELNVDERGIRQELEKFVDESINIGLSEKVSNVLLSNNYFPSWAHRDRSIEGWRNTSTGQARYRVFYEFTSDFAVAQRVLNELLDIDSFFCATNGFNRPERRIDAPLPEGVLAGDTFYNVYVRRDMNNGGNAPWHGTLVENKFYRSAINLGHNVCALQNGFTINDLRSLIAHEFFHAVMFAHGIDYYGPSTFFTDGQWFHEAFAEYASQIYTSRVWYHPYAFLNTAHLSLNTTNLDREYRAFIYPLYIHRRHGGISRILRILQNYRVAGNSYTAIDIGMRASHNSSLEASYSEFLDHISFPHHYFPNDTNLSWGSVSRLTSNSLSIAQPSMGGRYFRRSNTGTPRVLSITLNLTSGAASSFNASYFTTHDGTTSPNYVKLNLGNHFQQYRLELSNFGATNRRFVDFTVKNIHRTASIGYNYSSN
jgi:hypothetical protein